MRTDRDSRATILRKVVRALASHAPQPVRERLRWVRDHLLFRGSASYWEQRYHAGGTSGAGSYGRLALFKADVLNRFVEEREIARIVELGCGDGNQLELAKYPAYAGIDVSLKAVESCRQRFSRDPSKRFFVSSEVTPELEQRLESDLALSLDVVYHLVEDAVFEAYMARLFRLATRWVIVYSTDHDEVTDYPHVRHRKFTDWIARNQPNWKLVERIENAYPFDPTDPDGTSAADFFIFER